MEKDNLNLEALLKFAFSKLSEEDILKYLKSKKAEDYKEYFMEVDIPKDFNSRKKISPADIKAVRDNEEVIEVRGIILLFVEIDDNEKKINLTANIGKNRIKFFYPTSRKIFKKFCSDYRDKKKLFGEVTILYSPTLNIFSLHRLKVFAIQDPLKKWEKLMEGKTLCERIDILVSILGMNPEKMQYHEKIIAVVRLIPLVVKKVLAIDFSKKGIGKTHTYQQLDFNLYNTNVSKASAFIDGRNKKDGDFFYEDTAFIIDEAHRLKDEQILVQFQNYMSGDKYEGEMVVSGDDKRTTSVSSIFLGNVKDGVNLLDIYSDNMDNSGKTITLFSDTIVESTIDRGEAFISRVTLMPNSWGCREFSSSMKTEKVDSYNVELLKAVIPVLRDKELDINSSFIKNIYERIGETWRNPNNRCSESVEKNLEGLLKLLYCGKTDIPYHELLFLLERSVEMRLTVDNTLRKINPYTNRGGNFPNLNSALKGLMFNINKPYVVTPHRLIITEDNGNIIKRPLDVMGIELNWREKKVLDQKGYQSELKDKETLIHSFHYTRNFLIQNNLIIVGNFNSNYANQQIIRNQSPLYTNIGFGRNLNYNYGQFPSNSGTQNNDVRNDPSYNFLTGEIENLNNENLEFIINYSFYDID